MLCCSVHTESSTILSIHLARSTAKHLLQLPIVLMNNTGSLLQHKSASLQLGRQLVQRH